MGKRNRATPQQRQGRVGRSKSKGAAALPASRNPWLAALGAAGVLLGGYLLVTRATGGPIFCPAGGSGCEAVQSSRFGAVFGIPVAGLGLLFYAAVLVLALRPMTAAARWPLLFPLASAGMAASVVFVAVQQFAIRATCSLCLFSAALTVGIFALVAVRRPQRVRGGTWAWSGVAALAVAVLLAAGYTSSAPPSGSANESYAEGLARHLASNGALFYGAYWCPACQQQKALFGRAARLLPYVECDGRGAGGRPDLCSAAQIKGYPTWDVNGQRYTGVLPLEELARLTDYTPPPDSAP